MADNDQKQKKENGKKETPLKSDDLNGSEPEQSEKNQNKEAENETETKDPLTLLEEKAAEFEQEAKHTYDRFLRVCAEFENYKKRSSRETSEFKKFANESLIKELLSVVDDLERALSSSVDHNNEDKGMTKGVDLTLKSILKIFKKFGVEPIKALDEAFDPLYHQAVAQEEVDHVKENRVIKELQKGYMIHDRLLRPAMVVVSKQKNKTKEKS